MNWMPLIAGALWCALAAAAHADPIPLADITARADAETPKVVEWRRDIHAHPELANSETRTAALVAAHLKKLHIEVRTGVAHTGVVGVLRGALPGPVVALRTDMDALPVLEATGLPFASHATSTSRLGRFRPTPPRSTAPIPIGTNPMANVSAASSGEPVRW